MIRGAGQIQPGGHRPSVPGHGDGARKQGGGGLQGFRAVQIRHIHHPVGDGQILPGVVDGMEGMGSVLRVGEGHQHR